MAEDDPKSNPRFEDEVKSAVVGEKNIIYNYFYYKEEVRSKAVESGETTVSEKLPCPYRGLFHFGPNDAEVFFGREVFIEELFKATQTRNFIPVLGASGSGKSSVVLAGLIPKLEQEQKGHWKFTHFRPGSDPFHALALALVPLYTPDLDETDQIAQTRKLASYLNDNTVPLSDIFAKIQQNNFNHRILFIADQFEEIYTQCSDHKVRRRFLDCLLASFQSSNSGAPSSTVLVTTMRADFLGNALAYRPFADMLQNADIKLGAMSREELKEVIEKPAEKLGVMFEAGLVERILNDVEDEPGNLPLLEFALTELWKKRTGKQLTHDAYEAIGQVKGALADYADDKYKNLTAEEKEQARCIFIQLVRLGEGTEDTRRLVTKAELGEPHWNFVKKLADERLVVTSQNANQQETVEVVHEALILNWLQLRQWINEDRDAIRTARKIEEAAKEWANRGKTKDIAYLLQGTKLAEAENFLKNQSTNFPLSENAQIFVQTSVRKRKLRRFSLASIASVVIASLVSLTGWALVENENAQIRTLAASSEALFASNQKLDALIKAIEATRRLKRPIGSFVARSDTKARVLVALHQSVYGIRERNILEGHAGNVNDLSFSPDGKTIVSVSGDASVRLWNSDGSLRKVLWGHTKPVHRGSFSPDGQIIATIGDAELKLWNVVDGTEIKTLPGAYFGSVAFSSNGQMFAAPNPKENAISIFDRNGLEVQSLPGFERQEFNYQFGQSSGHQIRSLSFSSDDSFLAVANGNLVKLQYLETGETKTLEGHKYWVNSVDINPDNQLIVSASEDGEIKLWNQKGSLLKTIEENQDSIWDVTFSPNDQKFLSASHDGTIKIWDREGSLLETIETQIGSARSISHSPDGQVIAVGGSRDIKLLNNSIPTLNEIGRDIKGRYIFTELIWDGQKIIQILDDKLRVWNNYGILLETFPRSTDYQVEIMGISPDLKKIVTRENVPKNSFCASIHLRKLNGLLIKTIYSPEENAEDCSHAEYPAFSSDGKYLATIIEGILTFWDAEGESLKIFTNTDDNSYKRILGFSPYEDILAVSRIDNTIELLKLNGKLIDTIEGSKELDSISDLEFSPDGRNLVLGTSDGSIGFWSPDLPEVKIIKGHIGRIFDIELSPDSQRIISLGSDNSMKIWDKKGNLVETIQESFLDAEFSPDSQLLISVNNKGVVNVWSKDGVLLSTLLKHTSGFSELEFAQDGNTLFLYSLDGSIILLNFDLSDLLKRGCSWIHDYLSHNSTTENQRHICDGVETSIALLLEQGRELAKQGDINAAINKFQSALFLDPSLSIEPELDAKRFAVQHLVGESLYLVSYLKDQINNADQSAEILFKAIELNPNLDLDPEGERAKQDISRILVAKGERLAEEGKVDEAVETYKKAQRIDPDLDLTPSTKTIDEKPEASALIIRGKELAKRGDVPGAVAKFQKALELNPNLELEPETKAKQLAASAKVYQGVELAKHGEVTKAISIYKEAQQLDPTLKISANSWNELCWNGSLHGYPAEVMFACEKAIALEPENGGIRDSRGLARALTGDTAGAIEDFQAFLEWSGGRAKEKRQGWIDSLRARKNPFTDEELESLSNE